MLAKVTFLKSFLEQDEKIIQVTTGCSPVSLLELFLTGWVVYYLKRSLFVFTNKRIFQVLAKPNFSYRQSIAQIVYADCTKLMLRGRDLVVKTHRGQKEKFPRMGRPERKKIKALLKTIPLDGQRSTTGRRTHLCPRCTGPLGPEEYMCSGCQLFFKDR